MPSGAKKRKAAKKKKANDSPTPIPSQGENSQDSSVEVVKREDGSSETRSKGAYEDEGNIEIETVSKSKNSSGSSSSSSDSSDDESHVVEKKVVVLESAPVGSVGAVGSGSAVEALPEPIPPTVEPVKPVDSLLEEVTQVFDEMKNEEIKDLVVEEATVVEEQPAVDDCETVVKDDRPDSSVAVDSVSREDEVENVQPVIETASSEATEYVSTSAPQKDLIPEVNGADRPNEIQTTEHSDRQAPAASTSVAVHNPTTWKSCCGIFELFSRSERN